jgi:hypothetical protein
MGDSSPGACSAIETLDSSLASLKYTVAVVVASSSGSAPVCLFPSLHVCTRPRSVTGYVQAPKQIPQLGVSSTPTWTRRRYFAPLSDNARKLV